MIYSYDGTFFGYLSAVIDRDEALLRKDQAQPAVRADIFDLGQAIVPARPCAAVICPRSIGLF